MVERLLMGTIVGFVIVFFFIGLLLVQEQPPVAGPISFEPMALSEAEQALLLQLARSQLERLLDGEPSIKVDLTEFSETLRREASCFVSLFEDDALRGCMIDDFQPHEPLVQNVLRNAVLAATGDERFPPVEAGELERVRIEISVLGPLQAASFDSADELLAKFSPGVDGVVLATSTGQSAFLPWVWQRFPDPEQFLAQLCEKQGAEADCWRTTPLPKVDIFRVTDFSEANH